MAGDQDSSSSRYPADGLLSEQCVWHSFYAPVGPLLGSGSDTALPCCETLTTLILDTKSFTAGYRGEDRKKDGRGGYFSGLWDSGPADVGRVFWLWNDVAINT